MNAPDHARFEEQACLRVYGELDAAEARALDAHLATCERCRRFAAGLNDGLGVMAAREARDAGLELPADWRAALDARVRSASSRRHVPVLTFIAGLAAGLLVTSLASLRRAPENSAPAQPEVALLVASNAAPPSAPLHFDTAPPRSTTRGQAALLAPIRPR